MLHYMYVGNESVRMGYKEMLMICGREIELNTVNISFSEKLLM